MSLNPTRFDYDSVIFWLRFVVSILVLAHQNLAQSAELGATLRERIESFIESERKASGIPGIALAIVQGGDLALVRGFGHDGRGAAIRAETPFPVGSITKSFTALLVRQAIDAGLLEVDASVQSYLPWFRVSDLESSGRITIRHLLNQTSGFSRKDGMTPLLESSSASIEEISRGLAAVSLNRPVGELFEYSNLNYVLLGAVLQKVTGRTWQDLMMERAPQPIGMTRSFVDHDAARRSGMTAMHRMWFGLPVAQDLNLISGFAPTGSLVASAEDMGRYLQMLLAGGVSPEGRVLSEQGVTNMLTPGAPTGQSTLLSTDFQFRYGEGWFVGPFGAASDARWHLGSMASFAAWMVLLPDTKQAVVILINANCELPFGQVNAVMSRLPIGVVNLLRGQQVPQGPSLRSAYLPLNLAAGIVLLASAALAWWASRTRRIGWALLMGLTVIVALVALQVTGLSPAMLAAFAPDLALVLALLCVFLLLPATIRAAAWLSNSRRRNSAMGSL
jgi:CubicO group peptidase (beta-lactamase class C family)